MIKSTRTTLKFANKHKLDELAKFITEYRRVVCLFIDKLWELSSSRGFAGKDLTSNIASWLSARAIQCAGKQAIGIVKSCKKKQSKRLFQIAKFKSQGLIRKARRVQKNFNKAKVSKPLITGLQPELDSRFVKIELSPATSFDGWLTLASLGLGIKLTLPFKKTKHFNKLAVVGALKTGVSLSTDTLTLMFDIPEASKRTIGKVVGIDIGQTTTLACSDGQAIETDSHGHSYKTICDKLSRKERGSKAFERTSIHRANYLHWVINQLALEGIKQVNLEQIKHLRKGKVTSKSLTHWNYAELMDKLEAKLNDAGVQIVKVSPTYTSQRCSKCGWTRKGNRDGKRFKCSKCSFECDADLNGSINISFNLPPIKKEERLQQKNRKGFYWLAVGEELIVPSVQKAEIIF